MIKDIKYTINNIQANHISPNMSSFTIPNTRDILGIPDNISDDEFVVCFSTTPGFGKYDSQDIVAKVKKEVIKNDGTSIVYNDNYYLKVYMIDTFFLGRGTNILTNKFLEKVSTLLSEFSNRNKYMVDRVNEKGRHTNNPLVLYFCAKIISEKNGTSIFDAINSLGNIHDTAKNPVTRIAEGQIGKNFLNDHQYLDNLILSLSMNYYAYDDITNLCSAIYMALVSCEDRFFKMKSNAYVEPIKNKTLGMKVPPIGLTIEQINWMVFKNGFPAYSNFLNSINIDEITEHTKEDFIYALNLDGITIGEEEAEETLNSLFAVYRKINSDIDSILEEIRYIKGIS